MSYNIVENGKLKSITSSGMLIEGKPIYGERKQYATNKKMPLAGQASLKYTMDTDGILTGSCHKAGQGYSAWLHMNGKVITTFDNYGGESCSFDFPNVRVKVGDVIELTTNVPTTETTNFFWLNNIGVTPIVGVEPGIELQAQDTYSLEEIKVGTWVDGKPIYRKCGFVQSIPANTSPILDSTLSSSLVDVIVQTGGCVIGENEEKLVIGGYSGHECRANLSINTTGLKFRSSTVTYSNVHWWIEYTKK